MKRKGGLPTPKKALHGAPPPSPFLFAGLDELARDKRLCGRTMKGLLTMLHPPEALPAGHRLPECHSLSRPQSQHASLPFSARPSNPPEPTRIVILMIINVVMKVLRRQSVTRWCAEGGAMCAFHRQTPELYGVGPDLRGCRLSGVNVQPHPGMFTRRQYDFFFQGSERRLLSDPLKPLFGWAP